MKAIFLDQATLSIDLPAPSALSDFITFDATANDADLIVQRCGDADIIITNKVPITADVMDKLPKLKLIQICATGMNNVDLNHAKKKQISVKNVAGYSSHSVPEHTFMLMLGAMRAGRYYHTQATNGSWQKEDKFCLIDQPIFDLYGKTLGIIGAGNLGRAVATIARTFGMKVLLAERPNRPVRNSEYTPFDVVLRSADVLSLHCALTDETYHLINAETLATVRAGGKQPLLINMARGGCVDAHAVADALEQQTLMGFASDVFEQEPPESTLPLLAFKDHPRVFFTPHNAWASVDAQTLLWQKLSQQINHFVNDFV